MADTQVLGTCVFGRAGSSPASRTHVLSPDIEDRCLQSLRTPSPILAGVFSAVVDCSLLGRG
jgi:hypothetical protein